MLAGTPNYSDWNVLWFYSVPPNAWIVLQLGHNAPNIIQLTIHQSSHHSHYHNHGHHLLLLQPVPSRNSPLLVVSETLLSSPRRLRDFPFLSSPCRLRDSPLLSSSSQRLSSPLLIVSETFLSSPLLVASETLLSSSSQRPFWIVMPCTWEGSRRFGGSYRLNIQHWRKSQVNHQEKQTVSWNAGFLLGLLSGSENERDVFFRNVWLSPNYKGVPFIVIVVINSNKIRSFCSDCHIRSCHVRFILRDWREKLKIRTGTRNWQLLDKRQGLYELRTLRRQLISDSWSVGLWSHSTEVVFSGFLCE
jgi:hypothetical protein